MDNSKDENTNNDENPSNMTTVVSSFPPTEQTDNSNRPCSVPRTPFTNLSQVDADLALARTLQDQERAYMMLSMNGGDECFDEHNSEYDDAEEEDALDPASFPNDEAYARALQDAEHQQMAATGMVTQEEEEDNMEDDAGNSQGSWDDVDPDELSYEEMIALGEVVGTQSRGLSADSIASLCSLIYKTQNGSSETCVICRLEYEDGDNLILLSCKHSYHSECITNWLQINKVCPICSTEVSTSSSEH